MPTDQSPIGELSKQVQVTMNQEENRCAFSISEHGEEFLEVQAFDCGDKELMEYLHS